MIASDKDTKKDAKKGKMSKSEIKEQQEKLIREIIEEKMDIKGSYSKPSVIDVLWIQLVISPYTIAKFIFWYARWFINFNLLKKPYGMEEKLYLLRKNLGMGENQFNAIEEYTIDDYLRKELWIRDNFKEWKAEQDEEQKAKMAESNRYKSYRRYAKYHQISTCMISLIRCAFFLDT
jgi:DnaJ homolog subfamily C member 25